MIARSLQESRSMFAAVLLLLLFRADIASAITDTEATIFSAVIFVVFTFVAVVLLLILMYVLSCHKRAAKKWSARYSFGKPKSETHFSPSIRIYLQRRREERENGGQDMTDYNEKTATVVSFAETTFAERKVVAQEKRTSQNRLQRESETPLMEDEKKQPSLSSGEEAVTTEREAHFTTNPIEDEVFDEKDNDLKDDYLSFEERRESVKFERQESADVRKDSLAPLALHEIVMCHDEVPQEDRSDSPTQPTHHAKENPSPARMNLPLQSTPRPGSKRQSVHSLIDRSDSFTGAIDTPTRTGSSSESRKTSMILASAAAKLMEAEHSPLPLRASASVETDTALKNLGRSPIPLRLCASVETDTALKNHSPSTNHASQVSDPGISTPDLNTTSSSSIGRSTVSRNMNFAREEVQDILRRYSHTDPRLESRSFPSPANGRASTSSGSTPTRRRQNVATKLTYTSDLANVGESGREFNTLPLHKPGMSHQGQSEASLTEERKRLNASMQEMSRDKDRRRSAAAAYGHSRNHSGTLL